MVDGVYRKASSYIAKSVHNQKHKKIDTETFLYRTDKGIIDTEMHVAPLSGVTMSRGEGPETIGTMELRLYITRQIGVNHALSNIEKYSSHKGNVEDDADETATYKQIEPTFRMEFEKNCAPLDKAKATREQRKMEVRRPGTEPWAIFRFHYRSKGKPPVKSIVLQLIIPADAILGQNLILTWDPDNRSKAEPHVLVLEAVPPLPLGTKPHKDDGDSSTRASTPMAPDSPATPVKSVQKEQPPKVRVCLSPLLQRLQKVDVTSPFLLGSLKFVACC